MADKYWVNGTGILNATGFESNQPSAYDASHAKATTTYSTYYPYIALDTARSLIGAFIGWVGTGTANLSHHTDLDTAKILTRIYYENSHATGANTNMGVRGVTVWGSNNNIAPSNVTFTDAGDWVNLAGHGLETGQAVTFGTITGGTVTTITPGTIYYVRTAGDANKFNLSTTVGGAVMTFTTTGTPASVMTIDVYNTLTYAIDNGWTSLDIGAVVEFDQHSASNAPDPKYIAVINTTAYRYYRLKFSSNWGGATYMQVRRIEYYTEHISTSSGGAVDKADALTTSDNLTFDSNSGGTFTVTMSSPPVIHDLSISSGTITFSGSLSVSGSLAVTGTPTMAGTLVLSFTATAGTETVTTGTNTFVGDIVFNGSGGTFQLATNLTTTGSLTLSAGTFDANAKTISMSGTEQTITGLFTFYNLTRTGTATTTDYLYIHDDITIAGALTFNGNSTTNILTVNPSSINHAPVTLTLAGTLTATNTRFANIIMAGTVPYVCGAGCNNLCGNQNLDFGTYTGKIRG